MNSSFIGKIQETPTDWSFRFTKPENYSYIAGQYSVIKMEMKFPDQRHGARTCSFSSSPTEEYLQYTFTIRESGFKLTLMELEPGDNVLITPARGNLTLQSVTTSAACMIAGGIGVAPFRGILKYLYDTKVVVPQVSLLYSDKTVEEVAFKSEFDRLAESGMQIEYTLTRAEEGLWHGKRGRIDWKMIEPYELQYAGDVTYLLCGSTEMVQHVHQILQSKAIPRERIVLELFTGY